MLRRGITLLELLIVLALVAVIIFIALPTTRLNSDELLMETTKEHLIYLHAREQDYFNLNGKFAPFEQLAADPTIGPRFDQRFAKNQPVVGEVTFFGPIAEGPTFEIVAKLPDGSNYKINQAGEISAVK